jgi:hypothetical protein
MAPLRFANPSPPSGWIEDFHLQAVVRTRRTKEKPRCGGASSLGEFTTNSTSVSQACHSPKPVIFEPLNRAR